MLHRAIGRIGAITHPNKAMKYGMGKHNTNYIEQLEVMKRLLSIMPEINTCPVVNNKMRIDEI